MLSEALQAIEMRVRVRDEFIGRSMECMRFGSGSLATSEQG